MKHLSSARKGRPVSFLWGILGLVSVLIIIFFGYRNGAALSEVLKLCVLSLVLLTIIIFYISYQQERVNELPYFCVIFAVTYLGTLFMVMITKGRPEMSLWMSGGLFTALLFHMYLGYIFTFNFIIFAGFAGGFEPEVIAYLFILGTFMCLLSNYMKKITTLGYTAVIILSMQLILIFIINNFILRNSLTITAVYSLVSSLLSIGLSFGGYFFYTVYGNRSVLQAPLQETCGMDEILNLEFPLIRRLRQFSMKIYNHSLLISEISQKAAIAVGADEYKAKAGGLYHEIGRIENKEYVKEGVRLAKAYRLPESVIDIIRQHNIKYDKPKSPEAAIVMLAISIVATRECLEKAEKKSGGNPYEEPGGNRNSPVPMGNTIPTEKIVDNVFQMRLTKGSLDDSGLTLKQYNMLKEFFLHM